MDLKKGKCSSASSGLIGIAKEVNVKHVIMTRESIECVIRGSVPGNPGGVPVKAST